MKVPQKRRRLVLSAIAAGIILALALGYGAYRLGLRPAAATGDAQAFTISTGENAPTIAQHLVDAGLIRNRNAFVTYINIHGLRSQLKVGEYLVSPTQSVPDIAKIFVGGRTTSKRLIVPEGYTNAQVVKTAAALGIPASDISAALAAPHSQAFLATRPAGVSLEGYLFPDSYQIDSGTTADKLVNAMLDNFGQKVGQEYVAAFAAQGLNLHQGLTLASMVEREVNIPQDRPIVAQIFLKRFKTGQSLGSDVTTHYAAELLGKPFDTNLDSPYNTRRYVGLPPGPICNPGLGAMDAVAHPASTDYLYFLSGTDGKTYFAKTYAEHQANIAKHL